jgi:drug/metabolite transporter (DMT)-like permease
MIDRSTLLGLFAILLWSSTIALVRSISEQIGPLAAGATVYMMGGVLSVCGLLVKRGVIEEVRKLPRTYLFGCGSLFVIYTTSLFLALGLAADRHQTVEIGLINYLWPTLTILFSLLILSKRAGLGLIPGTLLALFGIFLVLTQGGSISWSSFAKNLSDNPVAYGLGLIAAISWALYSNLTRRWAGPGGTGGVPLFILAAGITLSLACLLHPGKGSYGVRVMGEAIFLSLATVSAYIFWDIAMRKGDVVLVASCSYLTPLLSTAVSCAYLRIMPGINLWLGSLLIVTGSFLSWRSITS